MPEVAVTRTDVAEARRRLATDRFVLVDVVLPGEAREGRPGEPVRARESEPAVAQPDVPSVADQLGLDTEGLDWFGRPDEPPRAEFLGDRAGLVVPVVHEERIVHVHVVVTERFVTSVHRGQPEFVRSFSERLSHEQPSDPVAVLFLLLGQALSSFRRAAVQALLEAEELEDDMFAARRPEQVFRLSNLRRRAALLHHFLRPFLEVTDDVLTRRMLSPAFPQERRRLAREFQTSGRLVLADIESLQEATRRAFASYSSLIAGEQNGVINRLAIVSVIFLPLSFLTGFFGMNFAFLTDELETRDEFWLLAVGLQVLAVLVSLYLLHRTRIWRRLRDDD
ncbi:CorA family divalent cation transporter [Streptomyces actinomycinicus]|uniref:CorA family divalent cation transporter n=2 Tax=Streptomyces actinomycinicus TaxID=1695166 RepID=A0A937JPN4_9ACTN|nr:CorA family divalent cation transporter [Streptomyces actinomycinicus]